MAHARWGTHPLRYTLATGPSVEPVLLSDVKNYLRIDSDITNDDALITMLISAARRYAERYTGLSFITQHWTATTDNFPGVVVPPTPFAAVAAWLPNPQPSPELMLLHGPVISVDSITYLDVNGTLQTMNPATDYVVDLTGIFPRIGFTAGMGADASSVPEEIKHWIMMRVGTLYENREEVAILNRGKVEALPFVDSLLDYYRQPVI
jgi:hypothetical protein